MKEKILITLIAVCTMLFAFGMINVSAETSGTCGANVSWTLDDSGTLTISGSGAMHNYSYSSVPWYSIREEIISVVIENGVTSIGDYAFYDCSSLVSITIPDSVTSIGDSAFACSRSLTDVYYNGSDEKWNEILIGSYNDPFVNATIHFIQEIPEQYRINEITIKDMSGNSLQTIPTGTFLATVSFTNVSSSEDAVIVLAQYTDAGAFKGLMYIQTEDVATGSTIKLSIPVDNSKGDVAKLKAFCWASFGSMTPLGNYVSFPTE